MTSIDTSALEAHERLLLCVAAGVLRFDARDYIVDLASTRGEISLDVLWRSVRRSGFDRLIDELHTIAPDEPGLCAPFEAYRDRRHQDTLNQVRYARGQVGLA